MTDKLLSENIISDYWKMALLFLDSSTVNYRKYDCLLHQKKEKLIYNITENVIDKMKDREEQNKLPICCFMKYTSSFKVVQEDLLICP